MTALGVSTLAAAWSGVTKGLAEAHRSFVPGQWPGRRYIEAVIAMSDFGVTLYEAGEVALRPDVRDALRSLWREGWAA